MICPKARHPFQPAGRSKEWHPKMGI